MAEILNLDGLTLNPEEAQEISQAIFEYVLETGELSDDHDIHTGIQWKTQIPFIGTLALRIPGYVAQHHSVFAMLCREAFVRVGSLSAAACTQDLDIGHGGEPCQCAIESGGHYEETVLCLVACACCLGIDRGPPVWFTDGIAQLVVVIYACRD